MVALRTNIHFSFALGPKLDLSLSQSIWNGMWWPGCKGPREEEASEQYGGLWGSLPSAGTYPSGGIERGGDGEQDGPSSRMSHLCKQKMRKNTVSCLWPNLMFCDLTHWKMVAIYDPGSGSSEICIPSPPRMKKMVGEINIDFLFLKLSSNVTSLKSLQIHTCSHSQSWKWVVHSLNSHINY